MYILHCFAYTNVMQVETANSTSFDRSLFFENTRRKWPRHFTTSDRSLGPNSHVSDAGGRYGAFRPYYSYTVMRRCWFLLSCLVGVDCWMRRHGWVRLIALDFATISLQMSTSAFTAGVHPLRGENRKPRYTLAVVAIYSAKSSPWNFLQYFHSG